MFLICMGKSKDLRKIHIFRKYLAPEIDLALCVTIGIGKITFIKEDKLYVRDTII